MQGIRALIASAQQYLAQLSRRERLSVAGLAVFFVLFFAYIAFSSVYKSIDRRLVAIEDKTSQLTKVAIFAQSYATSEKERKDLESKLKGPPVRLMSQLQSFAERRGLTISAMNDRGEQVHDKLKESLVELQVAQASIDKLTDFLNDVEHDPRIMKVRKLRLRTTSSDAKAINATLTIGTYQLVEKG